MEGEERALFEADESVFGDPWGTWGTFEDSWDDRAGEGSEPRPVRVVEASGGA